MWNTSLCPGLRTKAQRLYTQCYFQCESKFKTSPQWSCVVQALKIVYLCREILIGCSPLSYEFKCFESSVQSNKQTLLRSIIKRISNVLQETVVWTKKTKLTVKDSWSCQTQTSRIPPRKNTRLVSVFQKIKAFKALYGFYTRLWILSRSLAGNFYDFKFREKIFLSGLRLD